MNFPAQSFLVGLVVAFLSMSAYADDAVTIKYLDGYPRIGTSSERMNLQVSRYRPARDYPPAEERDVDRYFEQVSAVLTANGIRKDWQLAIPDAPSIKITVDIDDQSLQLVSCHTLLERSGEHLVIERGMIRVPAEDQAGVLAQQSEAFRRHRIAFEEILRLTLTRVQAGLSP